MTLKSKKFVSLAIAVPVAMIIAIGTIDAQTEKQSYGSADDVAFAANLWSAMLEARLVGEDAIDNDLYIGTHPHGAILESKVHAVAVNGVTNTVIAKRSYRGMDVSVEVVAANRAAYLEDVTVMFKRKNNYDTINQDWFWAKYNADGSLDATPNGVQLAGRIAKGKSKGCIACHRKAKGNDYMYIND